MATTTPSQPAEAEAKPRDRADFEQRGVMWSDIGWKGYLTLLKLRGEHAFPRMVYLDGTVWLMTTSFPHERIKKRLGMLVMVVVEEVDIPCVPSGSTTFRRKKKNGGVEPDESFYLANEERVRGKAKLHLSEDPPPDLVVEAVQTHEADAAVEVYRRFGVPEVWICEESGMTILTLQANGEYLGSDTSVSFPFLKAAEVLEWVNRPQTVPETAWLKELRLWVRDVLLPRARARLAAGGS
jgi:Uma2 family endonuclease